MGLSYYEFINCSFQHGHDGNGQLNGNDDMPSDIVYITSDGRELTRAMCMEWIKDWSSFYYGFSTAWKMRDELAKVA